MIEAFDLTGFLADLYTAEERAVVHTLLPVGPSVVAELIREFVRDN